MRSCSDIVDHDGPHAAEIKSAQERAGAQLAGTAEVHQQLHQRRAQLAELARKFVGAGEFFGVVLARQKVDAAVAQRIEQFVEGRAQAAALFFRIDALCAVLNRQRDAEHLRRFVVAEVADEVARRSASRSALGEQDVDREADARAVARFRRAAPADTRAVAAICSALPDRVNASQSKQSSTPRGDCWPLPITDFSLPGCSFLTSRVQESGFARRLPPASTKMVSAREPDVRRCAWRRRRCPDKPGRRAARVRVRSAP